MSSELWHITEHIIPASYPRGFTRAVRDPQTSRLRLSVKEYVPKTEPTDPESTGVTFIAINGAANGKESYEPMFDDLLQAGQALNSAEKKESEKPTTPFHIIRILNVDPIHQGLSVLLNIDQIGDGLHISDHARDILAIANHFQTSLQPPCIGISQSFGSSVIATAAALHPRIFDGIVMLEPLFSGPRPLHEMAKRVHRTGEGIWTGFRPRSWGDWQPSEEEGRPFGLVDGRASWMVTKRDWWPSREAALQQYKKNPWYGTFEPRVLAKLMQYELRDVAAEEVGEVRFTLGKDGVGPTKERPGVTLTTPKAMDLYNAAQPIPPIEEGDGLEKVVDREVESKQRFHRSELESFGRGILAPSLLTTLESIARMLPMALYVWGRVSDVWGREGYGDALVGLTGVARGGSGGRERGMVEEAWVECGHGPPFQAPRETGLVIASWLGRRMEGWREEGRRAREAGKRMKVKEFDQRWLDRLSGRDRVKGKL